MQRSQLLVAIALVVAVNDPFAQSSYTNPVDGKTYATPGEFKTYTPKTPKDQSRQRVKNEGITLLTGEPDLQRRTTVAELANFIRQAEAKATEALTKNVAPTVVMVQFNCDPKQCSVQLAHDGKAQPEVLQTLYESLSSMLPLRASGEVVFQFRLKVDA